MKLLLVLLGLFIFCYLEVSSQNVNIPGSFPPKKKDFDEMKEAVKHPEHNRRKRRANKRGGHGPPGNKRGGGRKEHGKAMCALKCIGKMEKEYSKLKPGKDAAAKAGLVGKEQAKNFDEICDVYNDTISCFSDCCDFPGRDNITVHFAILEQMCVVDYDAWKESMPCFEKTEESTKTACDPKCGTEEELQKAMKTMEHKGKKNMTEMFKDIKEGLDKVCIYAKCQMDCAIPIIDKECGSKVPGELAMTHIGMSMGQAEEQLSMFDLFPDSCKDLVEAAGENELPVVNIPEGENCEMIVGDDPDTWGPPLKPGEDPDTWGPDEDHHRGKMGNFGKLMDLQGEVLEKTLQVLEKESKKLDLEIEKLKLEKEKLEA